MDPKQTDMFPKLFSYAVKAGANTSLLILREIAEIAYKELRGLMDGKL